MNEDTKSETTKVVILRQVVQTGAHYGKKGQTVEVPNAIAAEWIAAKHAKASK